MQTASSLLSLAVLGSCVACGSNSSPPVDHDSGVTHDSAVSHDAGKDTGMVGQHDSGHDSKAPTPDVAAFTFTPSNFTASALSTTGAGDVEITNNGDNPNCTADSDMQTLTGPGCTADGGMAAYAVGTVALPMAGGNATVFVMNSLTIDSGAALSVTGTKPVIFYVLGAVSLAGVIDGTNDASPGATSMGVGVGVTPMEMGGGDATEEGGGGGSFCGLGGLGGFAPTDAGPVLPTVDGGYASGTSYGEAALIPLTGGSAGGGDYSGLAGGAIQITSNVSISIGSSGGIQMNGLGGSENNGNVGGGGSGGAILLEAPTVTIAGTLTANGGGGGDYVAGDDSPGNNGNFATTPASPAAGAGAAGGAGGAGTVVSGANGTYISATPDVGAGGGGAGWIRINTESGMASVTGIVSPSLMSKCGTQGTLK